MAGDAHVSERQWRVASVLWGITGRSRVGTDRCTLCGRYQERRLRHSHGQVLDYTLTKKELVLWYCIIFPACLSLIDKLQSSLYTTATLVGDREKWPI